MFRRTHILARLQTKQRLTDRGRRCVTDVISSTKCLCRGLDRLVAADDRRRAHSDGFQKDTTGPRIRVHHHDRVCIGDPRIEILSRKISREDVHLGKRRRAKFFNGPSCHFVQPSNEHEAQCGGFRQLTERGD